MKQRKDITAEITRARKEKHMTQADLARKVGIERSNICRIEKGQQNLSLDMFLKIADALDMIPVVELKGKEEE